MRGAPFGAPFPVFEKKLLTNKALKVIIFKHVRESVGMVDKHV